MSDETLTCKICGAELQGRDLYEGTCKPCREEAILGSAAPPKKPKPRKQPAPKPAQVSDGTDAIAIETDVDVEADTRDIPGEGAPHAPRDFAADASEGTQLGGLNIELPPSEEAVRRPGRAEAVPPAPAPPADSDVIAFDLASGDGSAPTSVGPPKVKDRPFLAPREAPARGERHDEDPRDAQRTPRLDRPAPLAPRNLPVVAAPTPPRAAEEPAALKIDDGQAPPAKPADDLPVLAYSDSSRPEPAPARPEPEAPPRRREAASPASKAPAPVSLAGESESGGPRTLARLAALEEQVQRLVRLAELPSTGASGRGLGFGFRAFFGFLMGLGVLGVVALLLMAVVGLVFYPPAFELLRRAFAAIAGGG